MDKTVTDQQRVIDLSSAKKEELVESIFKPKLEEKKAAITEALAPANITMIKISKWERAALPAFATLACFVAALLFFELYFPQTLARVHKDSVSLLISFSSALDQSGDYLGEDAKDLSAIAASGCVAGVNFLGDKISDAAIFSAEKTISFIE